MMMAVMMMMTTTIRLMAHSEGAQVVQRDWSAVSWLQA
jgi:hypothetical protein